MNKEPLVSIIMPTFNRAKYILNAINSCINQTHKNIEVIVIDDCSTDKTEYVVKNIKDKRVKYYKNEKNSGAPESRNKGIKLSKGEYICFLDDDDIFYLTKIEKQLKKRKESKVKNVGIITCDIKYNRSDKKIIAKNKIKGNIHKQLLKSYFVKGTPTLFIDKECFEKTLWDIKLPCNQEYDLLIRLSKNYSFDYVPEVLCQANESENQISFNFNKKIKGTKMLWKKHKKEFVKEKVYFYNALRFTYLLFKYNTGKYLGNKIYRWLR
jgi:glycosyltransferase involved in cell wall biosynthesis